MRNAVLIAMVLLLAVVVAAPVMALTEHIYDRNGNVIAASEDGFRGTRWEGTTGNPNDNRDGYYRSESSRRNDCSDGGRRGNSGYDRNRNDNYNYDNRRSGGNRNQNQTGINVQLGTKIGGVHVNLGYNKTTYSKPKSKPYVYKPKVVIYPSTPTVVASAPKPTPTAEKCRMTLVEEIGDGLETISPIVVTNPERELVPGMQIVFKRNGQLFAEYSVLRVVGDSVFVETINAPRGNPRQGDTFSIVSAE